MHLEETRVVLREFVPMLYGGIFGSGYINM